MAQLLRNRAFSTLAATLSDVATTLTVQPGHGDRFPVVSGTDFCTLTLQDASSNIEIVKVTARASGADTMTVVRAQEGTVARNWLSGDLVELRPTAGLMAPLSVMEGAATAADIRVKIGAVSLTGNENISGVKTFLDGIAANVTGNLTGNAATVTNGMYTTGDQTINGVKSFQSEPVYANTGFQYHYHGSEHVAYLKKDGPYSFYWRKSTTGLTQAGTADLMVLDNNGNLSVSGTVSAQAFSGNGSVPAGAVMPFAMASPPTGWLACNGAAVSRTTFAALFAAIGTLYGAGDGSTTFNLPDLRGEFIRGLDSGRGVDSGRALGSFQGSQNLSHTHTGTTGGQSNDHTHSGTTSTNGAHQHVGGAGESLFGARYGRVETGIVATQIAGYDGNTGVGSWTSVEGSHNHSFGTGGVSANHTHGFTTNADGGNESRPRNVALLYCIKA